MESSSFDLLAASLRADAADLDVYLEALAAKLSESFPGQVRVERGGGRFRGPRRVRRLVLPLGDAEYELERDGGLTTCSRRTIVRGVSLRTDRLPLGDWIDALARSLVEQADSSEQARAALARLLEQPGGAV